MSGFDDRENAFENKFAHDAEMQFKAEARRNKLVGLWAAELMGKDDPPPTQKKSSRLILKKPAMRTFTANCLVTSATSQTRPRSARKWPNVWCRPKPS